MTVVTSTTRRPSTTALHATERKLFRELNQLFHTMRMLDAAHASDEAYLAVSRLYKAASDEHFLACEALRLRYEAPEEDPDPPTPAAPGAALASPLLHFPLRRIVVAVVAVAA